MVVGGKVREVLFYLATDTGGGRRTALRRSAQE